MATPNETQNELRERPIGEVAKDLTSDLSLLVRQEIELAKAEMAEKGRTAAPGLGMFGGAGIVALCAAGALTAFLVLRLLALPARVGGSADCRRRAGCGRLRACAGKARSGSPMPATRFPNRPSRR